MSKPIISSNACPSKPISGSNVCSIKHVSVSSISPSKPISGSNVCSIKHVSVSSKRTCSSNVCPSNPFSAINVHTSKSVYSSNVSSRKPVSVSDVCPGKTISVNNVRSSDSVSAINVHPTKSISVSNICSGKPICRNNAHSSKPICRNFCQSKPSNFNILPCKSVLTDHIYHVNSLMLSQQLFFIFFLSILIFSIYYKFIIITMNIFTNLVFAIVILLSKFPCLWEFFILYISQSSTFLRSSLSTYITFRSFWTMLLLKTSEVSFFTYSIGVVAMLSIVVLNFSTSNVQTNCFKIILQKFGKICIVLHSFSLCLLFGSLTHFVFLHFYL